MISFNQKQLRDLSFSSSKEWILADGEGGFACGTVAFINTRRQHSLLTISLVPPLKRLALLNKVDEEAIIDGKSYFLSTNQYPGTIFPEGYKLLSRFAFDYYPQVTFDLGGAHLTKRILMPKHSSSVYIHYVNESNKEVTLRLLPLLSFRPKDSLKKEGEGFLVDELPDGVRILADMSLPRLYLKLSRIYSTSPETYWYRDFIYAHDGELYEHDREDLFNIGYWETTLEPGKNVTLAASTRDLGEFDFEEIERKYVESADKLRDNSGLPKKYHRLADIAGNHMARSKAIRGLAMIEGYPYGAISIRDTLLSLAGMADVSGEPNFEHNFLYNLVTNEVNGRFPAHVDEGDEHVRYDDPEIPLYFAMAVGRASGNGNGHELTRRFLPILESAAGIALETNLGGRQIAATGLLNLYGDRETDPGNAKVNAMLYNLLALIGDIRKKAGESFPHEDVITNIRQNYYKTFFDENGDYRNADRADGPSLEMVMPLVMSYSPLGEVEAAKICRGLVADFLRVFGDRPRHNKPNHSCNLIAAYLTEAAAGLKGCEVESAKMKEHLEKLVGMHELTNCVNGLELCGNDPFQAHPQNISSSVMVGEAIRLVKKLKLK